MHNRRAFTLIELLVVIAIIAILAAILFPVFAQAREAARATTCLSNCKQLGMGAQMYLQDYDETFFTFSWGFWCNGENSGAPHDSSAAWAPSIYPYVKNTGIYRCPDDILQWDDTQTGPMDGNPSCSTDGGIHDPFAPIDPRTGTPCYGWEGCNPNYNSYGMNEVLAAGNWQDASGIYRLHPVKLAGVRYPANMMLFADDAGMGADIWSSSWPDGWSQPNYIAARVAFAAQSEGCCMMWDSQKTAAQLVASYGQGKCDTSARHKAGANLTFTDGHAKFYRWPNLTWQNLTIGSQ